MDRRDLQFRKTNQFSTIYLRKVGSNAAQQINQSMEQVVDGAEHSINNFALLISKARPLALTTIALQCCKLKRLDRT